MLLKKFTTLPFIALLCIFTITLFFVGPVETSAKSRKSNSKTYSKRSKYKKTSWKNKKRKRGRRRSACNTTQGKIQAMELIRSSQDLSFLAGLSTTQSVEEMHAIRAKYIASDGELDAEEYMESEETADGLTYYDEAGNPIVITEEDMRNGDPESFRDLYLAYIDDDTTSTANPNTSYGVEKKRIMAAIMNWIGTPYYFGGMTRSGIDCSAFVLSVMQSAGDFTLPRTAAVQHQLGKNVRRPNMKFGDLVFFHTMSHAYVSHVGIYLGDNLFAHASSRFGVTISSLENEYYNSRLIAVKRLTDDDIQEITLPSAYRGLDSSTY
ncbi:MAG TPA: C40 family peptidase [Candidatus Kapabacteria bacterium]|jgi:hypothetical protein|nr:C40 family peptidase [Ignavibacteria bacterium]HRE56495.1 C40 family peptidase [Candidatus Kapabacteria bacterium]